MGYTRQSLDGVGSVLDTTKAILEDPCLVPVSGKVLRLYGIIEARRKAVATTKVALSGAAPAAPVPPKGIGLCKMEKPLNMAIWALERPWVVPTSVFAVVGGLVGIGYLIGKRT